MGKKLKSTPRSRVRAALRQLWLRSRERAAALKRDDYRCQGCGKKQSRAKGKEFKVQVHHKCGIEWEYMIDQVYDHILCDIEDLETLCETCHSKTEKHESKKNDEPRLD